uniref:Uncharacterized protein n=1 Tax=Phalansterium sp. PJK-2012 TaxID=1267188 RepID=T1QDZ9_9EUKA|nr:hypothetical protein [Phalansterium sp. PJK-2012]
MAYRFWPKPIFNAMNRRASGVNNTTSRNPKVAEVAHFAKNPQQVVADTRVRSLEVSQFRFNNNGVVSNDHPFGLAKAEWVSAGVMYQQTHNPNPKFPAFNIPGDLSSCSVFDPLPLDFENNVVPSFEQAMSISTQSDLDKFNKHIGWDQFFQIKFGNQSARDYVKLTLVKVPMHFFPPMYNILFKNMV